MSDALPTALPVTPPAPVESERRRNVACEFCGSKLAADGSVLVMGDKAKELRRADDKIDALKAEIARLEAENTTLRTERDALVAAAAPAAAADDDRY